MIFPLILLAIGLGAVAVYGLSPTTHQWVDDHVQAFKDAMTAHQAAEAHLEAAAPSPDQPPSAAQQDHVAAAHVATQAAAQATAQMATASQTQAQRLATTCMASLTHAMQDQIRALATLQIARGTERATAQRAFDDAIARIADAKACLAALPRALVVLEEGRQKQKSPRS